jgi:transcriptional regulator with GAF, ATPase, and Fis domain
LVDEGRRSQATKAGIMLSSSVAEERFTLAETLTNSSQNDTTEASTAESDDVIIGERGGLAPVIQLVNCVAATDVPVLILGESGAGKEVVARAIHSRSLRAEGPLVKVNCGAIPPELVDSELFGHERGSFTGAVGLRKGWFERADSGTLFLDEVGELPLAAQVRLLRVLQDGTFERVGGQRTLKANVRIVAATHRNLMDMSMSNRFRHDLWYRISVFPINLPALRDRPEDIPLLAAHFAARAGIRLTGVPLVPSTSDIELLVRQPWPGNVRELGSVIDRAAILGQGRSLRLSESLGRGPSELPPPPREEVPASVEVTRRSGGEVRSLDTVMVEHIERALASTRGRIEGKNGAAAILGINPHTLRARMRKLGIDWARFRVRGI